jgi:hypothetical protein
MKKVCPVCRRPPKDSLLVQCDQCKVPFVDEASLKLSLSEGELKQLATYILKSWRFWVPLTFGVIAMVWLALQLIDYATGRKVQHVIDDIAMRVSTSLAEADKRMVKDIARRFEEPNIRSLMEEVATKQAVARIDATADQVIEEKIRTQIAPRLEKTDTRLQEAGDALSRLQSLSEFYELATLVRSDDRRAFENIIKIFQNPSDSRFAQARAIISNLPKEVEASNLLEYSLDWKPLGIDPGTADISTFKAVMQQLRPVHQTTVMETVWNANHLSKYDRIQFVIDIVINTASLRCLDKGCRLLGKESKLERNFLAWQEYTKWWESHKQEYK